MNMRNRMKSQLWLRRCFLHLCVYGSNPDAEAGKRFCLAISPCSQALLPFPVEMMAWTLMQTEVQECEVENPRDNYSFSQAVVKGRMWLSRHVYRMGATE